MMSNFSSFHNVFSFFKTTINLLFLDFFKKKIQIHLLQMCFMWEMFHSSERAVRQVVICYRRMLLAFFPKNASFQTLIFQIENI